MPREAWVMVKAMVSDAYPDQGLPGPQPPFPARPPTGPVDPGYSPPWATPGPGGPVDPGYSPPWARPPVDPGYSPPWARPQPPHAGWPTVPGWPGGSLPGGVEGFPHPAHPIYIPVMPPEGSPHPEHPIYIPVPPNVIWGPTDPRPSNPIANPGDPNNPGGSAKTELLKKVKETVEFWTGNMPTDPNAPDKPTPV